MTNCYRFVSLLVLVPMTTAVLVGCGEDITAEDLTVTVTDGPDEYTAETEAEFTFECDLEEGCDFECRLEDDFEDCSSPTTYTDLADGDHTFEVRATAGGATGSPAAWDWTVDTTPPDVVGLEGPDDPTNETAAAFEFDCSAPDCQFECRLGDADPGDCEPGRTYEDLEDGEHTFGVRATDPAGNTGDEATWTWTVDTEPPEIEVVDRPLETIYDPLATLEFECTNKETCSFECTHGVETPDGESDSELFEDCNSPHVLPDLEVGDHSLDIVATDAAGNRAEEVVEWTVASGQWSSVSAGVSHTCGVVEPGTLWCWGDSMDDKLGLGDIEADRLVPERVGTDQDWRSGMAAEMHSCGLRTDASLWCWGDHILNQLGIGDIADFGVDVPHQVEGDWETVTGDNRTTCAIRTDGTLWCWGSDTLYGQLGLGDVDGTDVPMQVGDHDDWIDVAADRSNTCGVRGDGSLWCWGNGTHGTLGLGDEEHHDTPQRVGDDNDWVTITAGTGYNCAVREDGTLWCWGFGSRGKLGLGDEDDRLVPTRVGEDDDWVDVSGDSRHTCGLREDGTLWCWGSNNIGQLGIGDETGRLVPEQVGDDTDWESISVGTSHSCGIREDQSLWCWGSGSDGRLGLGDEDDRDTPTRVTEP